MNNRIGGIIEVKVNGTQYLAKGNFSYNLGKPKKEMVVGSDGVHGYKETPQVAYIEGAITDNSDILIAEFRDTRDASVVLRLANGKVISLEQAVEASDGVVTTDEGEAEFRFEGKNCAEIAAS